MPKELQTYTTTQLETTREQTTNVNLLKEVEDLERRHSTLWGSFTASEEDRRLLSTYQKRRHEAIDDTLSARNRSLKSMADAQAAFVGEMANSLLLRERTTLVVDASAHYHAERLSLAGLIEEFGKTYHDMVERKIEAAEQRHPLIRAASLDQIEQDLRRWNEAVAQALDDYQKLLSYKV